MVPSFFFEREIQPAIAQQVFSHLLFSHRSILDVVTDTTLITEQLIDYIRMPLSHGGGITHLQKVAAFASFYHIAMGFHGATDLSPVTLAAAIHFNTAINNFGIQEYMPHSEVVGDVFKTNYKFENGFLTIDDSPGIGVDIDEKAAARYPYITARLPVNRKSDGTLFNW
mgnify:CR=1 FL=1